MSDAAAPTTHVGAAAPRPLWWDQLPDPVASRPALSRDLTADVAIVGAGFTGLWTAYYLLEHDPALNVVIVERDHVGFGASGRNGGWCYDGFAAGPARIERDTDHETAVRWGATLRETVDEVGRVVGTEQIGCGFHKAGNVEFLRNRAQLQRARGVAERAWRYGWSRSDVRMLDVTETREIAKAAGVLGGLWSANAASLQPARLVHGLAAAVEQRGAAIYEATPATEISNGVVTTPGGAVTAELVVRATEGYTAELPGLRRFLAPLYSLMIATEPIPDELWDEIGLANRELFGDLRHLVIYGQRTPDGRIAFGGRGAPYDYASRIRHNAEFSAGAYTAVHATLVDLFPQLQDVAISHRWGGVLGVTRRWYPTAGINRADRLAWAGGYVGSGVAATNLAGRTLADLVNGRATALTTYPWVNRNVRRWEPEPLRWLGINAALRVMKSADRAEEQGGGPSARAEMLWRIVD